MAFFTSLHSEDYERRSHHESGVVHSQVVEPGDAGAAGVGAIFNRGGRQDRHPQQPMMNEHAMSSIITINFSLS